MAGEMAEPVHYQALRQVVEKRIKKFASVVPRVHETEDPEAVHDVRVWSRRVQQSIAALFPKPRSGKVRKLRRMLRRTRRALSQWRDCDVLADLAAEEERKAGTEEQRAGWELVKEFLRDRRDHEITSARKKLLEHDVTEFSRRLTKLLGLRWAGDGGEDPTPVLRLSIENGWTQWRAALTRVQASRDAATLHAFRIATKRLRYRMELLRDVGDEDMESLIKWLKELQDVLGGWHDRQAIRQIIAETLAQPEVLLSQPGVARALLAEMEKSSTEQEASIEKIFRVATDQPRHSESAARIGSSQ